MKKEIAVHRAAVDIATAIFDLLLTSQDASASVSVTGKTYGSPDITVHLYARGAKYAHAIRRVAGVKKITKDHQSGDMSRTIVWKGCNAADISLTIFISNACTIVGYDEKTLPAEAEKIIPAKPERVVKKAIWDCSSVNEEGTEEAAQAGAS